MSSSSSFRRGKSNRAISCESPSLLVAAAAAAAVPVFSLFNRSPPDERTKLLLASRARRSCYPTNASLSLLARGLGVELAWFPSFLGQAGSHSLIANKQSRSYHEWKTRNGKSEGDAGWHRAGLDEDCNERPGVLSAL